MFRKMRRRDKSIDIKEAKDILKKGEYGVLSTIGNDGYPYGVPLNYVYMNDSIYFHCAVDGHKIDNISNNNRVSFCVVGETFVICEKFSTKYESAIAFGKAAEVDGDEKYEALVGLLEKYSGEYLKEGKEYIKNAWDETKVIKISIEHITGKAGK